MHDLFKDWQLSSPELIASTHTSDVYKVKQADGSIAILKALNDTGKRDEAGGAALLQYYDGNGAIHLLRSNADAHLLEFADGLEVSALVKESKDQEATEIIADVIKDLHMPRDNQPPESLIPLRRWFRNLFEKASQTDDQTIKEAARVADDLLKTTTTPIPLHGDLHHHNILKAKRGWLAIDPKGLIGDACYDLGNIYGNPENMPDLWQNPARLRMITNIFVQKLGYPRDRIIKFGFVHNVISTIWDGGLPEHLETAKLIYQQLD